MAILKVKEDQEKEEEEVKEVKEDEDSEEEVKDSEEEESDSEEEVKEDEDSEEEESDSKEEEGNPSLRSLGDLYEGNPSLRSLGDLYEGIFAHVPRYHYSRFSAISKPFAHLVTSPGIYAMRSTLGVTETILYASIKFHHSDHPSWYILHRNPNRNQARLVKIKSLPQMPTGAAVVAVGSEIYLFGGYVGTNRRSTVASVIDCRFHTHRLLPSMSVERYSAGAGVIGGRIYVLGGCEKETMDWVEIFDLEQQRWLKTNSSSSYKIERAWNYTVMDGKLLVQSYYPNSYAYKPEDEALIESLENELLFLWDKSSCVIDGLLFSINSIVPRQVLQGYPIIVYNPNNNTWKAVKGVVLPYNIDHQNSKMANLDGKLVMLAPSVSRQEIWYAEIVLDRKEEGEIWGKIDLLTKVFSMCGTGPLIEVCRTVSV